MPQVPNRMSFQTFAVQGSPDLGPPRLAQLRQAMAAAGVDAFIVPRADAHQGEYVAARDARLAWLTGFTGSAGTCVVTADAAALFVDGRYTLQARAQVDGGAFSFHDFPKERPVDVLSAQLTGGQVVAYDPWLHVRKDIETLEKRLTPQKVELRPTDNLIDAVWPDQPPPPAGEVRIHPEALSGRSHSAKRTELGRGLREDGVAAQAITLPDSLSWLLNVRGSDIPRVPVMHGFALLHPDGALDLFTEPSKLSAEVSAHLGDAVRVHPPERLAAAIAAVTGSLGVDPATAPVWIAQTAEAAGVEVAWRKDPCILAKATKTQAELDGTRAAHMRDAAAMVEFLAWLDATAPQGGLTEIDVVRELEARRRATNALQDISFDTICGAGPDGAIVHYRVDESTNRPVTPGELLLIDSGGQYSDGTTDITRTVAVGPVVEEARRPFTLVLKGMIAISRARWPEGLAGRDLDALARIALWHQGLDYDHGTGHGVGVYLSVHEGPQNLSRRGEEPLRPGMILSNEPGYYREGAFGIRIENLVIVTEPSVPEGGEREMLGFETLTYVPIDISLIDPSLLTTPERDWLNAYHAEVRARLTGRISADAAAWLEQATRAIPAP